MKNRISNVDLLSKIIKLKDSEIESIKNVEKSSGGQYRLTMPR